MALVPYVALLGTIMSIRASFDASDGGRPIAEAVRLGFWYACLGGLASLLIGLVLVLASRPWR